MIVQLIRKKMLKHEKVVAQAFENDGTVCKNCCALIQNYANIY